MTSLAAPRLDAGTGSDASKRLALSVALSALTHALAIAILAGLLKPTLTPLLSRIGQAVPIEVALVGVRPLAFVAPPEMPAPAAELPIAPPPPETRPPLPPKQPPPSTALAQGQPPTAALPVGVSVQSGASADVVSADAPPPPGDVAGGAIENSERMGRAQALRLAQRFPRPAATPPRLREPLVVAYPPQAARARLQARIAALLVLDATGQVVDITLSPDEPLFGPTILNALSGARFVPAEADAKPMPYWVILEFVFTLRPAAAKSQPPR